MNRVVFVHFIGSMTLALSARIALARQFDQNLRFEPDAADPCSVSDRHIRVLRDPRSGNPSETENPGTGDRTGVAFRVSGIDPTLETVHLSADWRRHLKNIYRKLEVHSKSAAVARAYEDNLVPLRRPGSAD